VPEPEPAVRLLAGAWADERQPPERAGAEAGWHQPVHVRDPLEARRRLAAQVTAGADVIVAPAYWTARDVLARYGEARRAAAWTMAAVALAREAIEAGERADVAVAGPITPLVAASASAHAEILAEAGVDVLLVEQMESVAGARATTTATAAVGLPVWSGAALTDDGTRLVSGEPLGEWLEAMEPLEPSLLLLYGDAGAVRAGLVEIAHLTRRPAGAVLLGAPSADEASGLLDMGASVIGLAAGATGDALQPRRATIDAHLERTVAAAAARREQLQAWVKRAAAWAPGGHALWLGQASDGDLPAGFQWSVVPRSGLHALPIEHYRLVIDDGSGGVSFLSSALARVVEVGGLVLVARLDDNVRAGLRLIDRAADDGPAILRRE
jgi:hypothetical protein